MVNGNYVLYGDRPSSESEIVDDHVHSKTADRKTRRKGNRTANELQSTLNLAQLDNETDSIKYEKRIKEPRLLRYVPTTDVEENFVSEKFETYDLKPTEERPRRYAFTKKPKNPADGSVNYAYSRSSSSCSSPNGNLPTISEHAEQYGTYRVRPAPAPTVSDIMTGYESKLDKYFSKPREVKKFAAKGSHPDNLYRVGTGSGVGGGKVARALRILRWPAALVLVCVALAVFVYFLMPDNIEANMDRNNASYWEPVAAGAGAQFRNTPTRPDLKPAPVKEKDTTTHTQGTRTSEIDFYDAETDKSFDITSIIDSATETSAKRKLPVQPVFPAHITPEVQYGNEKADSDKLRTAKTLDETNTLPEDSTLKPHITQKPEKPLEIYFKDGNGITTTLSTSETITKAETLNDYTNYGQKYSTKQAEDPSIKPQVNTPVYQEQPAPQPPKSKTAPAPTYEKEPEIPPEIQEFYQRRPSNVDVNFTSGHSKLFGISIEDAEKMRSTTQSSAYNTRVSPTLPTWRDGDDSTTKNYPVNVNYDVPQCRSTRLALCRGVLPYDLAGPAVKVNGLEITSLLPQIEYLVATNCSDRVQQFTCALLEPECNPPPFPTKLPCYNFCKAISDNCEGLIPRELLPAFNCNQYSSANCLGAKAPCHPREMACGDGTCVPRDWICDGASDCPAGEDEAKCVVCEANEYKCPSGGCILKRWMCDGYADCPEGEDEADSACPGSHGQAAAGRAEPGEESAGSAPAPAIRRPFRVPSAKKNKEVAGENDSSKELLITSDSNNALKRNFTRRPSLSRLTPYSRPMLHESRPKQDTEPKEEVQTKPEFRPKEEFRPREEFPKETSNGENPEPKQTPQFVRKNKDQKTKPVSVEDIGDLSFLEEIEKQREALEKKPAEASKPPVSLQPTAPQETMLTRLDKSLNKLEKAIDGAALLRKAVSQQEPPDSPETNSTMLDKDDSSSGVGNAQQSGMGGWSSAHASPCPSGELRCVDGRCITLAQLCDGTIDCTDHADEDNCYT